MGSDLNTIPGGWHSRKLQKDLGKVFATKEQMLTGISTPGNVGIALYGDSRDLQTLHETVQHLAQAPNLPEHLAWKFLVTG